MPSTLVIADLHLSPDRPDISQCFYDFLKVEAGKHDALYILGDLFEYWIGDDDLNEFTLATAKAIKTFSEQTPVFYCHGNRDFMLGKKYAKRCGMELFPESKTVNVYGHSVLFMHGDQLCLDDVDYQKFRKKSRTWWWKGIMGALPLSTRRKIAEKIRQKSKESQKQKSLDIMDVSPPEVLRVMNQEKVEWLIHGHTHRPNIHELEGDKKRLVVGDWYTQGSVLTITEDSHQLISLPFKAN